MLILRNKDLETFQLSTVELDSLPFTPDDVVDELEGKMNGLALGDRSPEEREKDKQVALERYQRNLRQSRFLLLPEDVSDRILQSLDPADLARTSQVCRRLHYLCTREFFWERHASGAWGQTVRDEVKLKRASDFVEEDLGPHHDVSKCGPFRSLFAHMPRVRTDGVYVCKHVYIRPGAKEGRYYNPIFEVSYFRLFRFFSGGLVVYLNTPELPTKAVEYLFPEDPRVYEGTYRIEGDSVVLEVLQPLPVDPEKGKRKKIRKDEHANVERRLHVMSFQVYGTARGKNNRLYPMTHKIVSSKSDEEDIGPLTKKEPYSFFVV